MNNASLAIACGPIVTTWDTSKFNKNLDTNHKDAKSLVGKEGGVQQSRPHGDNPIASMCLSHNGQGKY